MCHWKAFKCQLTKTCCKVSLIPAAGEKRVWCFEQLELKNVIDLIAFFHDIILAVRKKNPDRMSLSSSATKGKGLVYKLCVTG